MTLEAPPLTANILNRFRDALADANAPLANQFEPGLTDDQIDHIASRLGVTVPPELRTLWRWAVPPAKPEGDNWDVNPEFELWPPTAAAEKTNTHRKNPSVSSSTIAFAGPGPEGFLLVEGGSEEVSPVIYAFLEDPDTLIAAPSLGALIEHWTSLLTNGDYRFVGDEWQPLDGPSPIILRS